MIPVIGHRGRLEVAPENTIRSFEMALELGLDGIEFDVRRTRDSELVVIHDETVDRTTDHTGRVDEYTLSEIQEFTVGDNERVPTLGQVLSFVEDTDLIPWINLKEPGTAEDVVQAIIRHGLSKRAVMLTSPEFVEEGVEKAKEAGVRSGISTGPALAGRYGPADPFKVINDLRVSSLLVNTERVNTSLIRRSLEKDIELSLVVDC